MTDQTFFDVIRPGAADGDVGDGFRRVFETFEGDDLSRHGDVTVTNAPDAPLVAFRVEGEAFTAGSKRALMTKDRSRAFVIPDKDTGKKKAHATAIKDAAREAMDAAGQTVLRGPLRVDMTVFRTRPKGHYGKTGLNATGRANPHPATRPDIDKLARNLLDRTKGIIYADDGQVVMLVARKAWGTAAFVQVEVRTLA
jgi:Holliday junction resolvase RusA-like endonuclease